MEQEEKKSSTLTGVDLSQTASLLLPWTHDPWGKLRPPLSEEALCMSAELASAAYGMAIEPWVDAGWRDLTIQVDGELTPLPPNNPLSAEWRKYWVRARLYSNVYTLLGVKKQRDCRVILADDKEFMLLLTEGESVELKLQAAAEAVSLLPLSESTTVDFTGVRWPLQQATLRQLYPYAISNEVLEGAEKICCTCHSGALGLYIRWAEGSK